ncbi:MAG TPA: hypothetical protein VK623_02490 [Flavobacterium sp.]|nr:hypothetical protein [Flavobacterium sp.]
MKKMIPNQLFNQPDNVLLLRKTPILMMKKLLFLLVFAFYCANISAQIGLSSPDAPKIMEVGAFISSLRNSDQILTASNPNAKQVENLLYKVQPSVYFYAGVVKTYGEKPKSLFTDIPSLSGLNNANMLKNNIEIVTVKINSATANSTIDLAAFSSFKNLKYVYILSSVDVTEQSLASKIIQMDDRLSVFYKVDRGDKNQ